MMPQPSLAQSSRAQTGMSPHGGSIGILSPLSITVNIANRELMHAEVGRWCFPPSVLRHPWCCMSSSLKTWGGLGSVMPQSKYLIVFIFPGWYLSCNREVCGWVGIGHDEISEENWGKIPPKQEQTQLLLPCLCLQLQLNSHDAQPTDNHSKAGFCSTLSVHGSCICDTWYV